MDASQLNWLSACDATRAIADGALSAEQLVEACLARITDADPAIGAWAYLDPDGKSNQEFLTSWTTLS